MDHVVAHAWTHARRVTYVAVTALLFTAALLAIYIPARRVSRIDPMVVLRTEGA